MTDPLKVEYLKHELDRIIDEVLDGMSHEEKAAIVAVIVIISTKMLGLPVRIKRLVFEILHRYYEIAKDWE